jgi:hypothetical protein
LSGFDIQDSNAAGVLLASQRGAIVPVIGAAQGLDRLPDHRNRVNSNRMARLLGDSGATG